MRRRIIVVPVVRNAAGEVLLCRMPEDRGVFPGQWGLPGGGIEDGESMMDALHREVREELGITVRDVERLSFRDEVRTKLYPGGRREELHLLFLLFRCVAETEDLRLNDEFDSHVFVAPVELPRFDLNPATRVTFEEMGLLAPTLDPLDSPAGRR